MLAKLTSSSYLNMQAIDSEDTALHLASRSGFEHIVRLLLQQQGVNTSLRNKAGQLAYDVAANDAVRQVGSSLFVAKALSMHRPSILLSDVSCVQAFAEAAALSVGKGTGRAKTKAVTKGATVGYAVRS